jgi:hypothetical protein
VLCESAANFGPSSSNAAGRTAESTRRFAAIFGLVLGFLALGFVVLGFVKRAAAAGLCVLPTGVRPARHFNSPA